MSKNMALDTTLLDLDRVPTILEMRAFFGKMCATHTFFNDFKLILGKSKECPQTLYLRAFAAF